MEEETTKLKVVDKRRFTEDGEKRSSSSADEASENSPRESQPAAQASPRASEESRPADNSSSGQQGIQQNDRTEDAGSQEVDYSSFLVSLATQAMMLMGEAPGGSELPQDLTAARHMIDIIGLLEKKTKGNLSEDEARLNSEILASLRMAFVKKSKETT